MPEQSTLEDILKQQLLEILQHMKREEENAITLWEQFANGLVGMKFLDKLKIRDVIKEETNHKNLVTNFMDKLLEGKDLW